MAWSLGLGLPVFAVRGAAAAFCCSFVLGSCALRFLHSALRYFLPQAVQEVVFESRVHYWAYPGWPQQRPSAVPPAQAQPPPMAPRATGGCWARPPPPCLALSPAAAASGAHMCAECKCTQQCEGAARATQTKSNLET